MLNTTGGYNTFAGYYSGYSNTTGGSNAFYGQHSGSNNLTGSWNTFLGNISGYGNPDNIHTWNAESTRATANWDANGMPSPSIVHSGNESFFGGFAESI